MAASLILRTVKGTPLTNLEVDNNFSNLSTYSNSIDANIGVLSNLTTTNKGNIVIAVNELVASNTSATSRISSHDTSISSINSNVGVLTNLATTTKANVVNAINEIRSGNLSQFAATTSAELAGIISNETGSGSLVFATSPTLSGTVSANNITLTNVLTTTKIVESVVAIGNTGTAATIDLSLGTVFTATLNGSATLTITNPGTVSSFTLVLTNDATPNRTVAWAGGTFKYPGGSVSRTTAANGIDVWFFFTPNGGTTWYGSIPMANLS